ncbi:xyloglucan endotransglucosylase/hydrolase protein 2-like [Trifolium pratense]|uniref:xyloglucan endotransglucosylase/hydrolase protein 2-like n=1 Tax=Trifolium pratense TaxID=57577 RepID=UPI001E6920F3|nr:xyloglucan endotransglucosylase/hydrolase protein 2-like [Trifolium pratense]
MNFSRLAFLLLFFILVLSHVKSADWDNVPFEQNYVSLWGQQNMRLLDQNREAQLTLDQNSGSGFQSMQSFGSGWFSMRIKLPPKDSTAVITTFYLISDKGPTRDEIDFEFLGGNLNQPPILHTNIYINGQGGREQQFHFWFDPTADFHDYTLLLNEKHIVFFVDGTPIRVFKNSKDKGGSYRTQAMKVYATIWTHPWGSGGVPINWNDAPFEAHYRSFGINACQAQSTNLQPCDSSMYWWNAQKFWELNPLQKQAYNNIRNSSYFIYDYCTKQPLSPEYQVECQGLSID